MVDNNCQFELNFLGSSKPVETGKCVCDVSQATKTSALSCFSAEHGLQTIKQVGRKAIFMRTKQREFGTEARPKTEKICLEARLKLDDYITAFYLVS